MWKCSYLALSLLYFAYAIQVPIVVKDTSGYGASSFPTSVVIPLPYGAYQTTYSFRLSDSSHTTIPCQFVVQSRWAAKDNSIRHIVAHFSATVAPYTGEGTGTTTIYFSDDGTGDVSPSSNAVTVTDNSGSWTISNGLIDLQVDKSSFTTISSLTLNGNAFMTSTGGSLLDRLGTTQLDSALPVYSAEIEENGPIRAVVKVTAQSKVTCSQFKDESGCLFNLLHCVDGEQVQVQHGYAVRIYVYAGVEFVKIDYQLQNTPFSDVVNGYPLYFEEMKLSYLFNLNTASSKITVGLGNNTVWSSSLTSNGYQLYQDFPTVTGNVFRIRDASTKSNSVTGSESDGFVDVSDSSSGVLTFIRNFWQSWPNAITAKIASSKVAVDVELFPKDGTMLVYGGTPDPSGLYWLDDMQHVYKEFYIYPHSSSLTPSQMISIANTFQWYPVAVVPASWYRTTSVTLDLGGHLPNQIDPIDYDTVRTLKQEQLDSIVGTYSTVDTNLYEFHWRHFGAFDSGYRDKSCTTGSWPYSVGAYLVTGNPRDYFYAESKGMGEINTRPEWMGGNYRFNLSMPYNYPGAYCGFSWRYWCGFNYGDQYLVPLLNDSNVIINPRDDEHGWFYHAYESYAITGNLWIKDWYHFIGQFRMSRLYEESVGYPDLSSRATGHSLNHAIQAFRVTGDLEIPKAFIHNIRNFRIPYLDPRYGDNQEYYESSGGGYQTGYYMRAVVDYLEEISDPQAWAEGFQLISALVSYNQKFSHFAYYWQPAEQPEGTSSASSSGSETCADPVAWYYYHTGIEEYREIVIQFQETGVPGFDGTNVVAGTLPYYRLNQTWTGDYMGRITPDLWNATLMNHDTRPQQIVDLAAYLSDSTINLLWTTPANAVKFHIVWSDRPISENHTIDNNTYCNWWAAHAVGPAITASPGSQQTVAFSVNGTTDYYVAMFSWDSIGNISPMSNVAKSTNDTFPGVATTTGVSTGSNPNTPNDSDVSASEILRPLFIIILSFVFALFN